EARRRRAPGTGPGDAPSHPGPVPPISERPSPRSRLPDSSDRLARPSRTIVWHTARLGNAGVSGHDVSGGGDVVDDVPVRAAVSVHEPVATVCRQIRHSLRILLTGWGLAAD